MPDELRRRKGPGRYSAVAIHPQRDEIARDLVRGRGSINAVARRYGLSPKSVWNYLQNVLKASVEAAEKDRSLRTADGIMAKLESEIGKLEMLDAALTASMTDPDDPTRFTNDIHAEDVLVIYGIPDPEDERKIIRRKTMLSELVKKHVERPFDVQVRREDTRRLYIDLHKAIGDELDRLAKILGLIKDVKINITRTESFSYVMVDILKATERFPEAREAIVAYFEEKAKEEPAQ